ncbi:zona pellucida sperm-binding protein 1 [Dasypus novemcinctus]|uniref:zona pellucida sperm-binding protein 1 n=1 Tax=Dasypus novemcinctus TaxID=9361 RepID=UPI00265FC6F9|nr:zona pellucida sperm-binding protein 1 [Dasypus novemcinctus]
MGLAVHVALLLLAVAVLGPALGLGLRLETALPGPLHSYACGVQGVQLLVVPRPGQGIRFKVLDEFGNRFEVNNCSICQHWISSEPRGPVVFSAGYKGCHVLEKDGRFHLRVSMEALRPDGRVEVARDIALICPKPGHTWALGSHVAPPTASSLSDPHSHTSGHTSPSPPYPASTSVPAGPVSPPLWPGPTRPAPAAAQWSTLEPEEVDKPAYAGTHPTQQQCHVTAGHIPCMVKNSKEACQQAGCCYDNTRKDPCYYGNTATVQCFRDGHSVVVVSQETALAHQTTLANVRLAYAPSGCPPSQETDAFVVFRFPLTRCGTTAQVVGNQLIYENQLASDMDVQMRPEGSITRDSTFRLHLRCIFNASGFLPIQASISRPPSPAPVNRSGPLRLELQIAKDETFRSYYGVEDYPLVRLLREPIHVEVRLLQRTDPRLALMLHQCWAAPSANPFQQPQWSLLSDGCPFDGDSYRTRLVALEGTALPFPSHYQRFTTSTFSFLDPGSQRALGGPVYLFCSASACRPSGPGTCATTCSPGMARRRRFSGHHQDPAGPQSIVSSPGPVGFEDSDRQEPTLGPAGFTRSSEPHPHLHLWAISLLPVALVLVVGVFVGLSHTWAQKLQEGTRG